MRVAGLPPLHSLRPWRRLRRAAWQAMTAVLGPHVTNGVTVGLGLILTALLIGAIGGIAAAAAAGVGILVATLADQPAQKHHKLQQLLPGPLLGIPLFLAVQLSHAGPLQMHLVLMCGTFVSILAMAWGKRGGPVSAGMMFSMIFALAEHPATGFIVALQRTGWYAAGAGIYLVYGVLANAALNGIYRNQLLAETLNSLAATLRTQSRRFDGLARSDGVMGDMLRQQAALADALQSARDLVLESPRTGARQRRAAILLSLLDARDHLLACDLSIDNLAAQGEKHLFQPQLRDLLLQRARELETLGTALLLGRTAPRPPQPHAPLDLPASDLPAVREVVNRVATLGAEIDRMYDLAHGRLKPDITAVRETWQLFISPTLWSWKPLLAQSNWHAPTVRHALRTALAIGVGLLVSRHLPWATHGYWILATITVVMRANLAQTLERRNARVAGTIVGCVAVMAILSTHPEPEVVLSIMGLAVATAHAFVLRRYFITSVAATLMGLMQAHLLAADAHPVFAAAERIADTVIGASIAWLCSYILPVWEKRQVPQLVARAIKAQGRHAQLALAPGDQAQGPDLQWRLARREAYDSLSALVQASARSRSEPAAVRPALEPLETLQALSYHMLAHLTAVKSMLQLRRGQLDMDRAMPALAATAAAVEQALTGRATEPSASNALAPEPPAVQDPAEVRPPDMLATDLTPWLLERLALLQGLAGRMRAAADVARA